jgi:hypothetical protein
LIIAITITMDVTEMSLILAIFCIASILVVCAGLIIIISSCMAKKRVRAMRSKKKSKGLKKFPKEITIGCDVGNQYYSSEPTTWV